MWRPTFCNRRSFVDGRTFLQVGYSVLPCCQGTAQAIRSDLSASAIAIPNPVLRTCVSLPGLFEIRQIGPRLVFLGGHQLTVGAEIVGFIADADMRIVLGADVGGPDRKRIGSAGGVLGLGVWPRHGMIDHGDLVMERVAVGLVEIDQLLLDGLAPPMKRTVRESG